LRVVSESSGEVASEQVQGGEQLVGVRPAAQGSARLNQ
jgi:hypothetical protein